MTPKSILWLVTIIAIIGISGAVVSSLQRAEAREALATELARPERCIIVVEPPAAPAFIIPPAGFAPPPENFRIMYLCGKDLLYHFLNPTGEVVNPFDTGDFN